VADFLSKSWWQGVGAIAGIAALIIAIISLRPYDSSLLPTPTSNSVTLSSTSQAQTSTSLITEPVFVITEELTPTAVRTPQASLLPSETEIHTPYLNGLEVCPNFSAGEVRELPSNTFIVGDVEVNGTPQYERGGGSYQDVVFLIESATITAPFGAECYIGGFENRWDVIDYSLSLGCSSINGCNTLRFVRFEEHGAIIEEVATEEVMYTLTPIP
jgi:hypothetical protein